METMTPALAACLCKWVRCEGVHEECAAKTYPLVDEHGNDQDKNEEDDDEDNDDTDLTLGPVLLALGKLVQDVLAASGKGHVDGGHCVCRVLQGSVR